MNMCVHVIRYALLNPSLSCSQLFMNLRDSVFRILFVILSASEADGWMLEAHVIVGNVVEESFA